MLLLTCKMRAIVPVNGLWQIGHWPGLKNGTKPLASSCASQHRHRQKVPVSRQWRGCDKHVELASVDGDSMACDKNIYLARSFAPANYIGS